MAYQVVVAVQAAAIELSLATFVVNHNFLDVRPIQRHGTQALAGPAR